MTIRFLDTYFIILFMLDCLKMSIYIVDFMIFKI